MARADVVESLASGHLENRNSYDAGSRVVWHDTELLAGRHTDLGDAVRALGLIVPTRCVDVLEQLRLPRYQEVVWVGGVSALALLGGLQVLQVVGELPRAGVVLDHRVLGFRLKQVQMVWLQALELRGSLREVVLALRRRYLSLERRLSLHLDLDLLLLLLEVLLESRLGDLVDDFVVARF